MSKKEIKIIEGGSRNKLPIISTPRLTLRSIQLEDISQEYIDWLNSESVSQYLETRFSYPHTKNSVEIYVTNMLNSKDDKHFGIYDSDDARLIGTVTFPASLYNSHHLTAGVSYVIGHNEAQGLGYATEALMGAIHYMFMYRGIEKIWAYYYEDNIASAKVLQKNGFKVEGTLINQLINKDCDRTNQVIAGLLLEDYLSSNSTS